LNIHRNKVRALFRSLTFFDIIVLFRPYWIWPFSYLTFFVFDLFVYCIFLYLDSPYWPFCIFDHYVFDLSIFNLLVFVLSIFDLSMFNQFVFDLSVFDLFPVPFILRIRLFFFRLYLFSARSWEDSFHLIWNIFLLFLLLLLSILF
jgi:hypothetical protein